jgi:hypothetical protein
LHAGIDIAPNQHPKLERLCHHVSHPPVAAERMVLTSSGHVACFEFAGERRLGPDR